MKTETEHKKKYGQEKFNPLSHNPTPWRVQEGMIWHAVVAANGKRVCNCRNIKDAELIATLVNGAMNTTYSILKHK